MSMSAVAAVVDYDRYEIQPRTDFPFPPQREQHDGTCTGVSERSNGHDSDSEGTLRSSAIWVVNRYFMFHMQLLCMESWSLWGCTGENREGSLTSSTKSKVCSV